MNKNSLLLFILIYLGVVSAKAQYTVILNFNGTSSPEGAFPGGSLMLLENRLYGTTAFGGTGSWGCIFSIDSNGGEYKDLLDFYNTNVGNGAFPNDNLILSGSKLFGMTTEGGTYYDGCAFSIDTNGGEYKDLFDFDTFDTNGIDPRGSLTLCGNKLYGMTQIGGLHTLGCVFSIDTNGSGYRRLLDFNGINGSNPYGSLTLVGNKLYGMTSGMDFSEGNIFSIDTNGKGYKNLFNFNDTNGATPFGDLTLLGNKFYGMTSKGGANHDGCIFSIDTSGSRYKDIFDFNGTNGADPRGSLIFFGNKLYGMTALGGLNDTGCIFSIDTNGNNYKKMLDFNVTNGAYPVSSLTPSGSTLYGMTCYGGADSNGVVFKIDTNAVASINNLTVTSGSINVYPNPSNGSFILSLSNINEKCSVEMFNILGEDIYQVKLSSSNTEINLSGQPQGIYFYRVLKESGELVGEGKIVIEH